MSYTIAPYQRASIRSADALANVLRLAVEDPKAVAKVGLAILAIVSLATFLRALSEW